MRIALDISAHSVRVRSTVYKHRAMEATLLDMCAALLTGIVDTSGVLDDHVTRCLFRTVPWRDYDARITRRVNDVRTTTPTPARRVVVKREERADVKPTLVSQPAPSVARPAAIMQISGMELHKEKEVTRTEERINDTTRSTTLKKRSVDQRSAADDEREALDTLNVRMTSLHTHTLRLGVNGPIARYAWTFTVLALEPANLVLGIETSKPDVGVQEREWRRLANAARNVSDWPTVDEERAVGAFVKRMTINLFGGVLEFAFSVSRLSSDSLKALQGIIALHSVLFDEQYCQDTITHGKLAGFRHNSLLDEALGDRSVLLGAACAALIRHCEPPEYADTLRHVLATSLSVAARRISCMRNPANNRKRVLDMLAAVRRQLANVTLPQPKRRRTHAPLDTRLIIAQK